MSVAAMVLHHQQAGLGDLDDAAILGNRPCGAPHRQLAFVERYPQVNAGAFHRRRHARERSGLEWHASLEQQRIHRLLRARECQRYLRREPFLAAQARPEGGVDHARDLPLVRNRGEIALGARARFVEGVHQVRPHRRRHFARSGIGLFLHRLHYCW